MILRNKKMAINKVFAIVIIVFGAGHYIAAHEMRDQLKEAGIEASLCEQMNRC